ncbi:MAG TPA: glycine cleavage system protein GcvH [Ilumatobacteraceae bacterium]|nr:glycine cleavage system protein GcvH [Ilumatobacteraceae bacterium]
MDIPAELRYSSDHEWVRIEGTTATIGITEYAQDALGDVVFVEMPDPGLAVAAGESFSEVESTKSVSDIYAPITGSIAEVNSALESQPELLNSDPYGAGWICRIEISDPSEIEGLMDADAYRALTEG